MHFGEVLRPHRADLGAFFNQPDPAASLRRDHRLVWDLVQSATEVWETYDALLEIATFLRRTPYTSLGVTKTRYLHFLIGAYLHEVYILKERVEALAKTVARKYRQDDTPARTSFLTTSQRVVAGLTNPLRVRGRHVHSRRYNDESLQHMTSLEFLAEASDNPVFRLVASEDFNRQYRSSCREWRSTIAGNNAASKALLDALFTAMSEVVFARGAQIRRPAHWPDG